jgi:hypothetical protein
VIEAKLFLELLMGLLADPAGLDGAGQLDGSKNRLISA